MRLMPVRNTARNLGKVSNMGIKHPIGTGQHGPAYKKAYSGPTKGTGKGGGKGGGTMANIETSRRGTKLVHEGGFGHSGQPSGKGTGEPKGVADNARPPHMKKFVTGGTGQVFKTGLGSKAADCFRGTSKSGLLRVSGVKGAHRLGSR